MRWAVLLWRIAEGLALSVLIAVMAWYLWLQEEWMHALDEFQR